MVEAMHARGQVSAADWATYLSQDEPLTFEVRPRCAYGDPIPYHLSGELRGATPLMAIRHGAVRVTNAVPGATTQFPSWGSGGATAFDLNGVAVLIPGTRDALRPGSQQLLVTVSGFASYLQANPQLFATMKCQGAWTLLAKGQPSVTFYRDEAAAALVQRKLSVHVTPLGGATVEVECDQPPVGLVLDAFLRCGGKEYPSGNWVAIRPGQGIGMGICTFNPNPDVIGKRVDVLLRPSTTAAINTVWADKLLDHTFVFEDVPVR